MVFASTSPKLNDGEGASKLLARATQITYYFPKQIPEPLEK
jgi:hypothetical protein